MCCCGCKSPGVLHGREGDVTVGAQLQAAVLRLDAFDPEGKTTHKDVNWVWQGMAVAMPCFQGKKKKKSTSLSKFMNVSMTICVNYSVIKLLLTNYNANENKTIAFTRDYILHNTQYIIVN